MLCWCYVVVFYQVIFLVGDVTLRGEVFCGAVVRPIFNNIE